MVSRMACTTSYRFLVAALGRIRTQPAACYGTALASAPTVYAPKRAETLVQRNTGCPPISTPASPRTGSASLPLSEKSTEPAMKQVLAAVQQVTDL